MRESYERNFHLNLFKHYDHKGTTPIENNLTRGLAISLEESPTLMMMFLEKINEKLNNRLPQINDSYCVEIQKSASKFNTYCIDQLQGITLTADTSNSRKKRKKKEEASETAVNPIPDICIIYKTGNDVQIAIVIEAKVDATDCKEQLKGELKGINDAVNPNSRKYNEDEIISLTWSEIISLLEQYEKILGGKASRTVVDYYDFLCISHPEWIPVKKLSELDENNTTGIDKYLEKFRAEYRNHIKEEEKYGRDFIPLNWDTTSECAISYDYNNHVVQISIWPGSTKSQYIQLKNRLK